MSKTLLVCDLDNTLYDWVGYFVPAFYAMVDEVVRLTNCDRDRLLDDFRDVHRHHHDSEHPFSLMETATVQELFPGLSQREIAHRLDSAFYAFNVSRKENLQLYPGVRQGLESISSSGVTLVAHTESKLFAVVDRLTRLDLTRYFRRIYCRERPNSKHPDQRIANRWLERFPMDRVTELSHHQRKPSPEVLLEICRDEHVSSQQCAYVGDSVARDILMAKEAGVLAIWAKYGSANKTADYARLVRISHWTDEDVTREKELSVRARSTKPDFTLERTFDEILDVILPSAKVQSAH